MLRSKKRSNRRTVNDERPSGRWFLRSLMLFCFFCGVILLGYTVFRSFDVHPSVGESAPQSAQRLRGPSWFSKALGTDGDANIIDDDHESIKKKLGRGSWNLLHRMAAAYPKNATLSDQRDMENYFNLFAKFYPCEECASHLRGELAEDPLIVRPGSPNLEDNRVLSLWLCRLHNRVNRRLKKNELACDLDTLQELYGDCGCFEKENETK
eukprot:g633.t1